MAKPNDLLSKIKIAENLGISRPQVDKYIESRGIRGYKIKGSRHPQYSFSEVKNIFEGRDLTKSRKKGHGKKKIEGGDYWKWKGATEKLKAEKLELELATRRAELVEAEAVRKQAARDGQRIKDRINAAVARLAPHCDNKMNKRIRREMNKVLKGK